MQNNQLSAQSGGSGNKLFSGGGSGQRGQRKEQTVNPGRQHEEARTNDDTQRHSGELRGKTDDIPQIAQVPTPACSWLSFYLHSNTQHSPGLPESITRTTPIPISELPDDKSSIPIHPPLQPFHA